MRASLLLAVVCLTIGLTHQFNEKIKKNKSDGEKKANFGLKFDDRCFCKLNEEVDDCQCKIESIDKFNNYKVYPRLSALMQKDYFRYIKVNLKKICQFWSDDAKCSLKDCHVKACSDEDLPFKLKEYFEETENQKNLNCKKEFVKLTEKTDKKTAENEEVNLNECEQSNPLGKLNFTISEEKLKAFEEWKKYDDSQDNFCEPDDEYLTKAEYVDLITNPERFTGYKAPHAHKIWNSIYQENCFVEETNSIPGYGLEKESCLEKRVFYRLVSGLHTSINIHLCSKFLHKGVLNQPDRWGPNPSEFKMRFDPANTNNQGPQWLKNLYFLYLVELRALTKAAPYFEQETFFTGRNPQEDEETKLAVLDLLNVTKNITKIMDCVGCDKCRLWGKVQTLALGTALKILFSGKTMGLHSTVNADSKQSFQLSRSEIVALFNGFARLSNSIAEIENFRASLAKLSSNIVEESHEKFPEHIISGKDEF